MSGVRIGQGFDAHRLAKGRKLIIGGVDIPFEKGLAGHSDADVLVHAVMDAVLGALCAGDIGDMFPPDDPLYKDARSTELAAKVASLAGTRGHKIVQIDATVIAQDPRLKEYVPEMIKNLEECFSVAEEGVGVKATTTDNMGFTGRGEGIAALAVALLVRA